MRTHLRRIYPFPCLERVRELLELDIETGHLTWKVQRRGSAMVGARAGHVNALGYRQISLFNKGFRAHQVVWALCHGAWPEGDIDHRNGNRDDNRPENLRVVTSRENNSNRHYHRRGKLVGVYRASNRSWASHIWDGSKQIHLGCFPTAEEAHAAYLKKRAELLGEQGVSND